MNEFEIFETARNLATAAEQDAFLAKACAGEPSVLARIKQRLQSGDTDLTSASSSSAHEPTRALSSDLAKVPSDDYGGETASTRIGDYRLVKRIGQGGMGSVWMAEQEQPVQRTVALKIIKAGMDTREVIARFEAERQALARMDHPNIAKVFDAGATVQGRPFFVMELVLRVKNLANCCRDLGHTDRAMRLYQEYVDRTAANDGTDSLAYADALIYLGFNQVKLARWAEAEPVLRECLRLRVEYLANDDWRVASTQSLLGAALAGLSRLDEAESLLISGYVGQQAKKHEMPSDAQAGITQARERLIRFYETRDADGDAEEAKRWIGERETDSEKDNTQ